MTEDQKTEIKAILGGLDPIEKELTLLAEKVTALKTDLQNDLAALPHDSDEESPLADAIDCLEDAEEALNGSVAEIRAALQDAIEEPAS